MLSRLPTTKYAIRTGTLSKQWKHLWTSVPTLIFDYFDENLPLSDFTSYVDKTLTQCCQLKLKKFQVHTRCDIQSGLQVNNWIGYAIRCNVEELNLELSNIEDKFSLDESFFINTCFTDLRCEGYKFYALGVISWKKLKRLCISWVDNLDEGLIEKIIYGSPLLETLVLNTCSGFRRLDITSKSVKKLVLDDCCRWAPDFVEIKAPNILSLTIKGFLRLRQLLLVNMSSLVEANLSYIKLGYKEPTPKEVEEEMLKGLILNLRHVKELQIGELCYEVVSRLEARGFVFPSIIKFPDAFYQRLDCGVS